MAKTYSNMDNTPVVYDTILNETYYFTDKYHVPAGNAYADEFRDRARFILRGDTVLKSRVPLHEVISEYMTNKYT